MRTTSPNSLIDSYTVGAAVVLHAILFGAIWLVGVFASDKPEDEEVIPIECFVVVHENLDGVEDEPPPERETVSSEQLAVSSEPEPEKVDSEQLAVSSEPEPEPPKKVEPKPEPKKVEPEPKKPDPPKKQEKTREERLAEMRKGVTFTKPDPPKNNGRTEAKSNLADELLKLGATPSNRNEGLDASEESLCAGRIKKAFHEKWTPRPSWTKSLKPMLLRVTFDSAGHVTSFTLTQSSGSASADQTVLDAAKRVKMVRGLTQAYLEKHPSSIIKFVVEQP